MRAPWALGSGAARFHFSAPCLFAARCLLAAWCVVAAPRSAQAADTQTPEETPSSSAPSEGPVEFVGGDLPDAPDEPEAESAIADSGPVDSIPPTFDDVAVAAGRGGAISRVTAIVTDDMSGVESVVVFFRTPDEILFREAKLVAGEGGLFLGQLPKGIQNRGFSCYLEAKDAGGNVAQLGTQERPFVVAAAGESDLVRIERQENYTEPEPAIHSAWIALALGTAVVVTVAATAFWIDFVRIQILLREPLTPAYREQVEQAALGDLAIAGVLSALAVVSIGTGTTLLVVAALDE
jgi:hypothetical protein